MVVTNLSSFIPVAEPSTDLGEVHAVTARAELETLAVVWGLTYFHAYLYGHSVTIFTDHAAVRAVLETANPSGKHT